MTVIIPVNSVAVVGAGTMGAGIAIVLAAAGFRVLLKEADEPALHRGPAAIQKNCMQLPKKMRKVGVLVGNCRGFVGNRMFGRCRREAQFLASEAASIEAVDGALFDFGTAHVGPAKVYRGIAECHLRHGELREPAAVLKGSGRGRQDLRPS